MHCNYVAAFSHGDQIKDIYEHDTIRIGSLLVFSDIQCHQTSCWWRWRHRSHKNDGPDRHRRWTLYLEGVLNSAHPWPEKPPFFVCIPRCWVYVFIFRLVAVMAPKSRKWWPWQAQAMDPLPRRCVKFGASLTWKTTIFACIPCCWVYVFIFRLVAVTAPKSRKWWPRQAKDPLPRRCV